MDYSYKNEIDNSYKNNINNDNDIKNSKYKILKDFFTPILREENIRQFLYSYNKKYLKSKNYIKSLNKNKKTKGILEYSFIIDKKGIKKRNQSMIVNSIVSAYNKVSKPKLKSNKSITSYISINTNRLLKENLNIIFSKKIINNNRNSKNNINTKVEFLNLKNNLNSLKQTNEENVIKKESEKTKSIHSMNTYEYKIQNKFNEIQKESTISSVNSIKKDSKHKKGIGFNEWYNYGKEWEKIKDIKYKIISEEMQEKKDEQLFEEKAEEIFKPKLNEKSIKIVNQNYPNDFFERQIFFEKKKKLNDRKINKKYTPLFKPNLSKSSNNIFSKNNKYII